MSTQLTYKPWAQTVMDECIERYLNGDLPTLDLQLSAKCSHNSCTYCDSKVGLAMPGEIALHEIKRALDKKDLGLQWVHICGRGEPLDDPKFIPLVELLSEQSIEISMFTNGLGITKDIADFLLKNGVSIILKLDSFDEITFDKLLGKKGCSKKVYKALENLLSIGYPMIDSLGHSRLAVSIVPTRLNLKGVLQIVEYCKGHGIFPSIGELEYAGKAKKKYNELSVTMQELRVLKSEVDKLFGYNYCRNLCPAALTSVHIDNIGNCVVDRETGLSCSWFMLREPELTAIGNIKEDTLLQMRKKTIDYRLSRLERTLEIQKTVPDYPFGGCGGSPSLLLESYLAMMDILRNKRGIEVST